MAAGAGQNVGADTPFPTNLQVAVFDGNLNFIPGATVQFAAPTSGASGTFAGGANTYTTTTSSTGLATASTFTSNATTGQYMVTATATLNGVSAGAPIVLSNGRVKTNTRLSATVTFSATVTPNAATGTVTFMDGTTTLGSRTLNGGTANFTTSSLTAGTHGISAVYSGDTSYPAGTSAALSQAVSKK